MMFWLVQKEAMQIKTVTIPFNMWTMIYFSIVKQQIVNCKLNLCICQLARIYFFLIIVLTFKTITLMQTRRLKNGYRFKYYRNYS